MEDQWEVIHNGTEMTVVVCFEHQPYIPTTRIHDGQQEVISIYDIIDEDRRSIIDEFTEEEIEEIASAMKWAAEYDR